MQASSSTAAIAIGGMLSVAVFGGSGSAAEPTARAEPETTPITQTYNGPHSLNSTSGVHGLHGALTGVYPPVYDGAVQWGSVQVTPAGAVAFAVIGGLVTAGVATSNRTSLATMGKLVLGGALVAGAISGCVATQEHSITFDTRVQEVIASNGAHMEHRFNGKYSSEHGPYFGQVISIPETDLLLSANAHGAPLLAGQKIRATFVIDSSSQAILRWSAVPGLRE